MKNNNTNDKLFFFMKSKLSINNLRKKINENYKVRYEQFDGLKIVPKGIAFNWHFIIWKTLFSLVSYDKRYSIFMIENHKGKVIHYSIIFPKYFRFPFMCKNDLQIGSLWTDPTYRGQGLATYAIQEILLHFNISSKTSFWYIVESSNSFSIKAAENCGFYTYGLGYKRKKGFKLFSTYEIENLLV